MIKVFQFLAVFLGLISAYFLWADNFDWGFAAGVAAICSYFLGMRFQIKARMKEGEATESAFQNPIDM